MLLHRLEVRVRGEMNDFFQYYTAHQWQSGTEQLEHVLTGGTVETSKKGGRVWLIFSLKMNTEFFFELMLNMHESATFPYFALVRSHKNL